MMSTSFQWTTKIISTGRNTVCSTRKTLVVRYRPTSISHLTYLYWASKPFHYTQQKYWASKKHRSFVSFLAISSLFMYPTEKFIVVNKTEKESRMNESCTRAKMELDNWKSMEYYTIQKLTKHLIHYYI
ncbi:hypothetical protein V8G54_017939 [Vigna mungo]|uniref:Uncharacterized protein n=1 Tax=Vigna mungo TaxID=3915 RepID=A0AAQ3RTH0_VIGMU